MIGGFFAIPNAAARVCVSPEDTLALYWCCRQADAYGWGTEFDCSNTMLQDAAGGSRSWAQRWVVKMVRVGSLVVTDPGHRHKMRVVLMPSPFGKVDHHEDHHSDHHSDHQSNARKRTNGKSGPPPGPPLGPPVPQLSIQTKTTDSKTRRQTPKPPSELATVMASYVAHHKARSGRTRKAKPKGMSQRVTDHGSPAALLVLDWAFGSDDPRARLLRDGDYLDTTLFGGKFETYLDLSTAWDGRGRVTDGGGRTPQEELALLLQMQNDRDCLNADRSEWVGVVDAKSAALGWPTMRGDMRDRGTNLTSVLGMNEWDLKQLTKARR